MVVRRGSGERRRVWREAIARQRASGLGVRAFCRREQLAEPSFYAWRKRLATERSSTVRGGGGPTKAFAEVRVVESSRQPAALPEGCFAPPAWVEIVLVDGVRVRVPPGVDRRVLADVLVVLQERTATPDKNGGGDKESPAC